MFGASVAHAAETTATASANILEEVTVSNTSGLAFGTIVADPDDAGTISVDTDGDRTCGDLVCSETASAASFDVTGTTGETVTISVPADVTLTNDDGDEMTADLTSSDSTLTLVDLSDPLETGNNTFTVGGDLGVAADQADGDYTGTFTVTVDYE